MQYFPEFAALVADYLNQQDRTPTWLAYRLQINPGTVNRWLNRNTRPSNPEMVIRIADLLGIHRARERWALLAAAGYGFREGTSGSDDVQKDDDSSTPKPHLAREDNYADCADSANTQERDIPSKTRQRRAPFMAPMLTLGTIFGRDDSVAQIARMFALDQPNATNVPPVALQGMAGVGKTAVALAYARSTAVRERFPDGVLWASLGPNPVLKDTLVDWGQALGVDISQERNERACHERLRNILYDQQVLVIVDDVWETNHCDLFQVVGPDGCLLVTTRESPIAFKFATRARTLRLDILSASMALRLLHYLAPEAVTLGGEQARQLCERLEFLPLALVLAGRLLANEADVPSRMRRIMCELINRRQTRLQLLQVEERLGLPDHEPASLQAIIAMSVERLSLVDQQRFAKLSTIATVPFTWKIETAIDLWSCTAESAETTMSSLIQRGLATRRGGVYRMHALLVDYAADLLGTLNKAAILS